MTYKTIYRAITRNDAISSVKKYLTENIVFNGTNRTQFIYINSQKGPIYTYSLIDTDDVKGWIEGVSSNPDHVKLISSKQLINTIMKEIVFAKGHSISIK